MQIIDGNSLGWAHHSATKLNYAGFQTQSIFGMAKALREIRTSYPGERIFVLWDGRAKHRFAELETYKGDREKRREEDPEAAKDHAEYKRAVPIIKKAFKLMGVPQLESPDHEADDIAGLLCKMGGKKRLVTGDTDWLQLVSELVDWYDPRNGGKHISMRTFHEATGYFSPGEHIQGKALIGDTADSIPGVDGVGDTTAAGFLAKWRSVDAFFAAVDSGAHVPAQRKSKVAKTLHPEQVIASPEGRALFARNMRLMDLRTPHSDLQAKMVITPGAPNFDGLQTLLGRLGMVSILRDFNTWVYPFGLMPGLRAA